MSLTGRGSRNQSLVQELGRQAQLDQSANRFESLHNITLDYDAVGLSVDTICILLGEFNMSQVPISRLTEKVLARIFVHLQQMHQGNGAESYQWLPIVRVCKQWRSTAISCPELWSIIRFNIMPLDVAASWITRRSDNHPMGWIIGEYSKVESQNEGAHKQFCDLLKSSLPHIDRLEIDIGGHQDLLDILKGTAQRLKYLRIHGKKPRPSSSAVEVKFPSLSAPSLRHVVIENRLAWTDPPFRNLSSLIINCNPFRDNVSVSSFLETLRRSPSLTVLSLGKDLNVAGASLPIPSLTGHYHYDHPIRFRSLQKMVLKNIPYPLIGAIKSICRIPPTASVVITMPNTYEMHALASASLADTFLSYPNLATKSGHIVLLASDTLWKDRRSYSLILQDDDTAIPPRLWYNNPYADTTRLLSDARLSESLSLTIHYQQPYAIDQNRVYTLDWSEILPQYIKLQTIRAYNEDPLALISPLLPAGQTHVLDGWEEEIRSALSTGPCACRDGQGRKERCVHLKRTTPVMLGGEPASAQVECGFEWTKEAYVTTVITKSNNALGYDKERIRGWLIDTWMDSSPICDVREIVSTLEHLPW